MNSSCLPNEISAIFFLSPKATPTTFSSQSCVQALPLCFLLCLFLQLFIFSLHLKWGLPTASTPSFYQPFRVCLPGTAKPYVPSSTSCDPFFTLIPTTLGLGHSCDTQLTLSRTISLLNGKLKDRYVFILAFPLEASTQQGSLNVFNGCKSLRRFQGILVFISWILKKSKSWEIQSPDSSSLCGPNKRGKIV